MVEHLNESVRRRFESYPSPPPTCIERVINMDIKAGDVCAYVCSIDGTKRFCIVREITPYVDGLFKVWGVWKYESYEHALTYEFENTHPSHSRYGWMPNNEVTIERPMSNALRLFIEE